jgi:hypothetical protein
MVVVPPLHSVEESVKEIKWAKTTAQWVFSFAASRTTDTR